MYRFAPSPTGDMHIGNLRAAIFNYICAKQSGKDFILRIEDTDQKRNIEGKDEEIKDIMAIFGLQYDHLYYQSDNFKFHMQFASRLMSEGKAFACFCTEEELEAKKEQAKKEKREYRYDGTCLHVSDEEVLNNNKPFVIRFKRPDSAVVFKDDIKGELSFEPYNIDHFVIMRADKYPTYNFACSSDDMIQGVTSVIRGEDHVSNTPKQELIKQALGLTSATRYAHLPIILNGETGKKMSKRDDASSVKWLLDEGYMPESIANYLISMGNKTPKEIFSLDECVQWFDITKISKSPARFDMTKLRFINREQIKIIDDIELSKRIGFVGSDIGKLAKFYTQEASTTKEIKIKIDKIFSEKKQSSYDDALHVMKSAIKDMDYIEDFDEFKKTLMQKTQLKGKDFFKPLRFLLTGEENGPNLSELYPYIKTYIKEIAR